MQFPDFFFFADLAYQMQSLVIQVTKTPGIDHFQSVETAGDFGQFLLIQKKIGVLISGKIQMIVAECTAAPFAPAAPKKQDLPGIFFPYHTVTVSWLFNTHFFHSLVLFIDRMVTNCLSGRDSLNGNIL